MGSTRYSSPVSDAGSSSTPQLTPNSKVKAMLAALDNESDVSDNASVSGSARIRLMKSLNRETTSHGSGNIKNSPKSNEIQHVEMETSEDEAIVPAPRGRIAAAMRAQARQSSSEREVDTVPSRKATATPNPRKNRSTRSSSASNAGSDESDVPVVSRKRKIRTSRHSTPEMDAQIEPTSPGLFVSPTKSIASAANASDSDELPVAKTGDSRFAALVERKRKETEARERAKEEFRAKEAAERKKQQTMLEQDEGSMSDGENGRRLTQHAKPTRKASKKALEEMHRETQRLSRNQQLAHYATTKKKFATKDFLRRIKGEPIPEESPAPVPQPIQTNDPGSSSPMTKSDVEMQDTPPTSPVTAPEDYESLQSKPAAKENIIAPSIEQVSAMMVESGPFKAEDVKGNISSVLQVNAKVQKPAFVRRHIRVRPAKRENDLVTIDDSDSDLEILPTKQDKLKAKLDAAFSRAPLKKSVEDQSLYTLRMLAHLKSPGKQNTTRNKKSSITNSELELSLHQKARQQAAQVKQERLEELRRRGITIQTSEEREKEMAEIEDLITKARREAEEITQKEKAAAKQARKEAGEVDPLGDSSDDEDWEEGKNSGAEGLQSSDSEGEADLSEEDSERNSSAAEDEDGELDEESEEIAANPMFDNEASETEEDDDEEVGESASGIDDIIDDNMDEEEDLPILRRNRQQRKANVISDDEEEPQIQQTPSMSRKLTSPNQQSVDSPAIPTSVLRSATKTFIPGLTVTGPVGLGLTQIFAGTMDESQVDLSQEESNTQQDPMVAKNDSLAFLRRVPAPSLPPFVPTLDDEDTQALPATQSQSDKIPESQPLETETQRIQLNFTQSQIHGFDSLVEDSQMSQYPEATQDVGFVDRTPIKGRFVDAPPSTVDTMVMDPTELMEDSPVVKRKGKLTRRAPQVFSDDEEANEPVHIEEDFEINENIFDVMRKAAKPKKVVVDDFDKKKSKAKEMVQEQADESEDEYAGLGGASDDESDGEADEYVKAMIDDETGQNVDKAKIAAFFADRERANDEKAIEKLYKDITTGMMRRKRGADYDLSDSDDGGEARRRMKRKEFAKMRKALLADERIGKIAENPKRQAFLRAIEDRGSEDEMDFLNDFPEQENEDSQSQSQVDSQQVIPNSQPGDMGPPKRKRSDESQEEERLPPHLRRTKAIKKPANLSELRESLSSLIEEPNAFSVPVDIGSDSEDDLVIEDEHDLGTHVEKDKENRNPFALRRSAASIVDRISLKRESSSNLSTNTRLAFATTSDAPGFKVPALLRRATTNSLSSTTSITSSTERMAGGSEKDGVKRGGGKNSGINYFARETERRAAIQKTEARREKKRFKGAEVRRKVVGGLLGAGKFE